MTPRVGGLTYRLGPLALVVGVLLVGGWLAKALLPMSEGFDDRMIGILTGTICGWIARTYWERA